MKPIYTFLIPLGLCFILSGLFAETTYSLSIGRSNINQQKTITPAAPTGDPVQALCPGVRVQSSNININTESGASISWYNSESSDTALPASSFLPVGDNTYYISQTVGGIESVDRFQVRVLIQDLFLTYSSEICAGTSTSITFNNNVGSVPGNVQSFSWSTSETSTTINVTPTVNDFFPTNYYLLFTYNSGISGVGNLTCVLPAPIYSRDIKAPVAFASSLADVTAQCSVTSLTAPTATDNCAGTITGTTTTSFPITTQGTTVVTWTFDDGNGNTSTQTQNIIIDDTTPPTFTTLPASLGTDLISYWPFNGNILDESGNGSSITNNGATITSDRNNLSNSAYAFNGSQYMTFDTSSAYTNWIDGITVSVWFYLDINYNGNPRMFYIGQTDGNNKGVHLMVQSGNIGYVVSPGGGVGGLGQWSGVNAVPTGSWHHALFRANFSNGDHALFIDGQVANSGTNTNQVLLDALNGIDYSPNPGNIGQKTGGNDKWQGKLDDIAIWKRPLSNSEILNVFSAGQLALTNVTVECDTDTSATTLGSATATDNCGGTVAITSTDTTVAGVGNN